MEDSIDQQTIIKEIENFFDDGSIPINEEPAFAVIDGPLASGKTTFRNQQFKKDYVIIDAGEIYMNINNRTYYGFGTNHLPLMEMIGYSVVQRALLERRNIVMEFSGLFYQDKIRLIDIFKSLGYTIHRYDIHCGLEECEKRNLSRNEENISIYFSHEYHYQWIIKAVEEGI